MNNTTNSLNYYLDINNSKVNCRIHISLKDECNNGHEDFHITGTFWKPDNVRIDRNVKCFGCTHEEILKIKPEFKIFEELHGNDFQGYPSWYIGNAFYFLKNKYNSNMTKSRFMEVYCITSEQYDELMKCSNEDEFGFMLIKKFNNHLVFQKKAKKAIKILEKLTEKKFESKATRAYSIDKWLNLQYPDDWFLEENVKQRNLEKFLREKHEKISKFTKDYELNCKKLHERFFIEKQLMELDFLDLRNTDFCFDKKEFHINIPLKIIGTYRIENSKTNYTFTEDDYNRMHIQLPPGYKLIFNPY